MSTNTKLLAEWTLGETYNYCYGYRRGIKPGVNCDETDCLLKKQGICMADYVHDWELTEQPRFTVDEMAFMEAFYAAAPNAVFVREGNGQLYLADTEQFDIRSLMPRALLPSILPGASVTISEVIHGR